jgi:AbrB family looped-hinge helix DNA binding protein
MKTTIRKIGNRAGVILPAAIREQLHLNEGDSVEIEVQGGQVVIKPCKVKPMYTLSELVTQCDENAPYPDELRNWDEAPAVGQEAL